MGAVDFGIIVDGGVVIVESILARLALSESGEQSMQDRIRRAIGVVVRPTVFAMLIIMAAYLPIFLLERVEGRIFSPMANTVVSALLGALVFSLTLIPALACLVYRRAPHHRESPVLRAAFKAYNPALRFATQRPGLVVMMALAALLGTALLIPRLGSEFLPELNEGALYVTFTLPSNIALSEGRKLAPRLAHKLASAPQAESVLWQLGRPEDGTDAALPNNLEFFVRLKTPAHWPKETRTLGDVIDAMTATVSEIPGLEVNFSQPIRDNVNENISGQFGQVAVKVYGDDLVALQAHAEQVKKVIGKVDGVADLGIVKSAEVPYVQVAPDRGALARYGMSLGDFQHAFQTALAGLPLGDFWDGERRFSVAMRLPLAARDDIEKIRKLRVPVEGGALQPLEALARVNTGFGRASINRENGRRYIGIRMNVRGRDMGRFVDEARDRVQQEAPLPPGMTIEWGGEFENKERAMARLRTVVPVALLITLLLLFQAFGSVELAALTLLNVPFALVGGVVGLYLTGLPLSVAAAVGFIALIGQAALNGVLVLSAIEERRSAGVSVEDAIVQGCRDRLRPVLMTASLAALGLIPAALSRAMGSETQRPLAVVIVAGTLSACALTLIVLPAMYQLFMRVREQLALRMARSEPSP
jgi:cobalt-zinc-cadmium resistance protein CzcA